MKKIILADWMGKKGPQELEYSFVKRNEIINAALEKGLQVMIYIAPDDKDILVIYTDNRKFRQR